MIHSHLFTDPLFACWRHKFTTFTVYSDIALASSSVNRQVSQAQTTQIRHLCQSSVTHVKDNSSCFWTEQHFPITPAASVYISQYTSHLGAT